MTENHDDAIWRDWLAGLKKPGVGVVIALTLIGGVLRFIKLGSPPLLFDEAATYTRVCGTFGQLFDILRYDGFAPLHYVLYWAMGKCVTLTPMFMRLVPAICGTLMIPAIYFLARQMTSPRVATIAAALTAFSAYMLVYSRDAKMYMELWVCATIFIAAFLWWLREGGTRAWLLWVASATLMNWTHALGMFVIAVACVFAITHPLLTRRKLLLTVTGLFIACIGIALYFKLFNRFTGTGLDWIAQRNVQFSKPFLLWDTLASWFLAYRSPRPPIDPPTRVITPVAIVSGVLIALLIAGAMPWKRSLRDDDPELAPPKSRGVLWLSVWILLPAIIFYVQSFVLQKKDVWNARYLAIVWPAVIILVALAFQRLPHPFLRAGAITLFIGANLIQFGLRLSVENGAPVDQIARDVENATTIIAVKDDPDTLGLGGTGGIFDFPGKYYLTLATGKHVAPMTLRDGKAIELFDLQTDVRSIPSHVTKIVVWQDGPTLPEKRDPILKTLGPGWKRTSSVTHAVRDFWCWRSMFRCQRSVYERTD